MIRIERTRFGFPGVRRILETKGQVTVVRSTFCHGHRCYGPLCRCRLSRLAPRPGAPADGGAPPAPAARSSPAARRGAWPPPGPPPPPAPPRRSRACAAGPGRLPFRGVPRVLGGRACRARRRFPRRPRGRRAGRVPPSGAACLPGWLLGGSRPLRWARPASPRPPPTAGPPPSSSPDSIALPPLSAPPVGALPDLPLSPPPSPPLVPPGRPARPWSPVDPPPPLGGQFSPPGCSVSRSAPRFGPACRRSPPLAGRGAPPKGSQPAGGRQSGLGGIARTRLGHCNRGTWADRQPLRRRIRRHGPAIPPPYPHG